MFVVAFPSLAATPAKPHKKHHPVTSASAAHAAKPHAAPSSKAATRRKGKAPSVRARSYQQAPTSDRYREIQQALVSKGYLQGEPSGKWGPDSTEALKRFQAEQNLMPDGKINSLSLIALGLGPKRLTAKSDAVPAPVSPGVPPQ